MNSKNLTFHGERLGDLCKGSPFLKCVVSIWAWPVKGGGGCKGLPGWFGALFFPGLPGGVRACQDGLRHFFSTFACLIEGGRGSKAIGQCPYRTNTFQKGASLKQKGNN